jgi:hypothetical protein
MSVTTPNYVCKFDKFSKGIILYVASRRRWFVSQSNIPNHFTSNISDLTVDLTSELVYHNNFFLFVVFFCFYGSVLIQSTKNMAAYCLLISVHC